MPTLFKYGTRLPLIKPRFVLVSIALFAITSSGILNASNEDDGSYVSWLMEPAVWPHDLPDIEGDGRLSPFDGRLSPLSTTGENPLVVGELPDLGNGGISSTADHDLDDWWTDPNAGSEADPNAGSNAGDNNSLPGSNASSGDSHASSHGGSASGGGNRLIDVGRINQLPVDSDEIKNAYGGAVENFIDLVGDRSGESKVHQDIGGESCFHRAKLLSANILTDPGVARLQNYDDAPLVGYVQMKMSDIGGHGFGYHVAPVVRVKQHGKMVFYVVESFPQTNGMGFQELGEWAEEFRMRDVGDKKVFGFTYLHQPASLSIGQVAETYTIEELKVTMTNAEVTVKPSTVARDFIFLGQVKGAYIEFEDQWKVIYQNVGDAPAVLPQRASTLLDAHIKWQILANQSTPTSVNGRSNVHIALLDAHINLSILDWSHPRYGCPT